MNQHGTTLHDMMTVILPEDLLDPRHLANTEIITLKTLRLVNREFSTTALRSVKSCEVHVGGDRTSPNPEQLCRLMAEATLVKLKLTVTVTSGPNTPTPAQQLERCLVQVAFLVNDMSEALGSIYILKLVVIHCIQHPPNSLSPSDPSLNFPAGLEIVAGGVFAAIAALVPFVHQLEVSGCCPDMGLPAFGEFCPYLEKLTVQALCVPVAALHNMGQHIPALKTVIFSNSPHNSSEALSAYVDAALLELQHCASLTFLHFDFQEEVLELTLTCTPQNWALMPESLEHLGFECFVETSDQYEFLIRQVKSLWLRDSPYTDLLTLVLQFAFLESLKVLSDEHRMWLRHPGDMYKQALSSGSDDDADEDVDPNAGIDLTWLDLLKERLEDETLGFDFSDFGVAGTSEQIRGILGWLPPIPSTTNLVIELRGGTQVHCLELLAHSFPDVGTLIVIGDANLEELPSMNGMEVLAPLAECLCLTELRLSCPQLLLTTTGLTQLCISLPLLRFLTVEECEGVDVVELQQQLLNLGRNIEITQA